MATTRMTPTGDILTGDAARKFAQEKTFGPGLSPERAALVERVEIKFSHLLDVTDWTKYLCYDADGNLISESVKQGY